MIRGVRGAVTVDCNSEEVIISATEELLKQVIEGNNILPEQVASVFISTTDDLNAAFPARALRKFPGWTYVPVMCMRELAVPNALPFCVRVMLHVNTAVPQEEIVHVYLGGAKALRPDLGNTLTK
ncbi:chorismate mutase [Neobacillus sp. NPDC093182]|uniref:chorismate mutase n=1 Tax=Neobacillus sp. NPDC093182 TaxID=3364297 RepID=UPI0037F18C2F